MASTSHGSEEAQNVNEPQQSQAPSYKPEDVRTLNAEEPGTFNSRNPETTSSSVSIEMQDPAQEQGTLGQTQECSQEVQRRVEQFEVQHKFTDANGKPLEVSQKYGAKAKYTDEELIGSMQEPQLNHIEDRLNQNMRKIIDKKDKLSSNQVSHNSTYSSIGNTLGLISSNSGTIGAGKARKEAGEDEAKSQLSSAASQGMQGIMGQLLKTANDAIQQVQQVIQTFATISNGNKFQG